MRFACWITKTTVTHSEHAILKLFLSKNGFTNAPRCYVYSCIDYLVSASYWHVQFCQLAGLNCSNIFKQFLKMFLDFQKYVHFVCTHTMKVVSLMVGFHDILVFLYHTFLPIFMCLYFTLCTCRRHDMNIYDLIILRYVVRRLRKRAV